MLPTASRPSGLQNWRYAKWPTLGSVAGLHCGISQVLRTFTWSVAYGQSWVTAPLPPQGGEPQAIAA